MIENESVCCKSVISDQI